MELKDLIKRYRAIKPNQDWVERNRAKILAAYREAFPSQHKDLFFYFKPVFVTAIALFVFVVSSGGLVVYAQKATPGDVFYSFKRLTEQVVYQFTPANQRPVLRAEMVERRINEVRVLAEKNSPENLENQLSIKEAAQELEKEIIALKKEVGSEKEVTASCSDLAICDNRKIIEGIKNKDFDLNKILAATKEAIKENNLIAALEGINEVEKIFYAADEEKNDAGDQDLIPDAEVEIEEQKENLSPPVVEKKIIPTPVVENKPTQVDFKIEIEKEAKELTPN